MNYFDKKDVFLTQTWQLYAEPAIFGVEKIFTIAPTFRAEKSLTARHLTEFWMAEMELAWATFDDVINHGEAMMKHIVKKVLRDNAKELAYLERDTADLDKLVNTPFVRMTYTEALEKLKENGMDVEWGKDLRTLEEEKTLRVLRCTSHCHALPESRESVLHDRRRYEPRRCARVRLFDCGRGRDYRWVTP